MIERRFSHEATAFDAGMVLGDGERIFLADFCDVHALDLFAVGNDEVRIRGWSQEISVESRFFAVGSGVLATVPKEARPSPGMCAAVT